MRAEGGCCAQASSAQVLSLLHCKSEEKVPLHSGDADGKKAGFPLFAENLQSWESDPPL